MRMTLTLSNNSVLNTYNANTGQQAFLQTARRCAKTEVLQPQSDCQKATKRRTLTNHREGDDHS